jgi:hypothetical protein
MGNVVSNLSEANKADYALLTAETKVALEKEYNMLQESMEGALEEELMNAFVGRIEQLIGPQVEAVQLPGENEYSSVEQILASALEVRMT